jgi:outer membrane protein assembly factor BamB
MVKSHFTAIGSLGWVAALIVLAITADAQEPALQRIFNQLQQLGEPAADAKERQRSRDPVAARAPRDPRLEAILTTARDAIGRNDWKLATERLQTLLDLPDDALILTADGRGESIRTVARRTLAAAPAAVLSDYERQYGGLARQLLEDARRTSSIAGLVNVTTRFPASSAGREASRLLAAWHFDHSDFALAHRAYQEEWDRDPVPATDVVWRVQAAYSALRAGESAALSRLLTGVTDGHSSATLKIGGRDVDPATWWKERLATPLPVRAPLTEWRQLGGDPARDGIGSAGGPLLLPTWSAPLTSNSAIVSQLRMLLTDLAANRTVAIPAMSPVIVGDRIAFRDLRGVRVSDLETGKTLWETAEGISPERILNGLPPGQVANGEFSLRDNPRGFGEEYVGESAQHHPLANWLYRDGTSGLVSSDGRRLFVLEDVAVLTRNQAGYQWEGEGSPADPFGADWTSNRLSAYDLQTGRLLWTVGGPRAGEVQELALAGTFFLGVPVAAGGELYVTGTRGEEIRLHALDPDTGRPRWSQLLAYSDSKINLDLIRRWIGAPVSVSQGLVLCPTTSGWLIAVDRWQRKIAWANRYLPPPKADDEEPDESSPFLPQTELGESWGFGAPIVHGSRVLFAPPDADALVCLSLVDGRIVWKKPRRDGLQIATVTDDGVAVLAESRVVAYALADGKRLWEVETPEQARPSGRPAVLGTQLAVPFSDNQVWLMDLTQGNVTARWRTPADQPPLENLVKVGDRLVSLGAHGCRLFAERSQPQSEVLAQQSKSATDPVAVLQQAELLLLDQQPNAAVALLKKTAPATWSDGHRQQRWQTLWRAMSDQLAADPTSGEDALTELTMMASTDEQRWLVAMRQVDRDVARQQFEAAFDRLWEMARKPGPAVITPANEAALVVQRDVWLRGRFADVWTQAPVEVRSRIDARMQQLVAQALAGPLDDWLAFGRWCDFHPAAAKVSWALADVWAKAREFARAEAALSAWTQHADPAVAVESRLRLARLWQQFGLDDDARTVLDGLSAADHSVRLSTGDTLAERLAAWPKTSKNNNDVPVSALDEVRRHRPLVPQRVSTSYAAAVQAVAPAEPLPFFQRIHLQIDSQEQRLTMQDRATGRWTWLAPLRTGAQSADAGHAPTEFLGHRALVLHRGVLQLLSLPDQRIVWTRPLERALGVGEAVVNNRQPPMLHDPNSELFSEYGVTVPGKDSGPIAVANEHAIVMAGSRTLTAFDPTSGRELWRREGLSPYVTVVGSSELVIVHDHSTSSAKAYRDFDGRAVEIPKLDDLLSRTLAFRGRDAITLEAGPGFRLLDLTAGKTVLRRVDPVTQTERWQAAFRPRTVVGLLTPGLAIAVQSPERRGKTRAVTLIDLDTGRQHPLAALQTENTDGNLFAFCDADRIYVACVEGNSGGYHYGDSLSTLDITGELCVWDRHTGDRLWQRTVDELNLVYDRFADSPVLILMARNWEMLGNANFTKLRLLLLDKQTGEVRHESSGPSLFSGFHGVEVTAPDNVVELTSYNLRLRFEPQP